VCADPKTQKTKNRGEISKFFFSIFQLKLFLFDFLFLFSSLHTPGVVLRLSQNSAKFGGTSLRPSAYGRRPAYAPLVCKSSGQKKGFLCLFRVFACFSSFGRVRVGREGVCVCVWVFEREQVRLCLFSKYMSDEVKYDLMTLFQGTHRVGGRHIPVWVYWTPGMQTHQQ
jgi:hypothetical protein